MANSPRLQRQIFRTKPEPWTSEPREIEVIWEGEVVKWAGAPGTSPYPDGDVVDRDLTLNLSVSELKRLATQYQASESETGND